MNNSDKRRLLVVEDDSDIATLLKSFGIVRGFHVDICPDGLSALERAKETPYDVLLLDVSLPKLDGRDLLVELHKCGAVQNSVVIFLTARDAQSDRVLGLELGADDYIAKPVHMGRLFAKIDHLCEKRGLLG